MITQNDIQRLTGTDVYDRDGDKIGSAGQVYLDDATGNPEWISVQTGFFGTKESFVPLSEATFSGDRLTVPFEKAKVKDAPRVDPDGSLSEAEEDELYTYYGLHSVGGRLAGTTTATGGAGYDRDAVRRGPSGPATDDAMTRSEERLTAGTRTEQTGRARLRKHVVTEQQQVTVPVRREEVRLEREPITEDNVDRAMSGPAIKEDEYEVTLSEERPVVQTETVPVERVRLNKETVAEQRTVSGEVRKEQIDLDDSEVTGRSRR